MAISGSFLGFSFVALGLLLLIGLHSYPQEKLMDNNNRLFNKIYWLAVLDICFDIISIILAEVIVVHSSFLLTFVNAAYFEMNALMCYNILIYSYSLQEDFKEIGFKARSLFAIPTMILTVFLVINFPLHIVFSYDSDGNYYHGSFYYVIYFLAMVYLAGAVFLLIVKWKHYHKRKRYFMIQTFSVLFILIMLQWLLPRYMLIDLGIAFAVLLFYIHNNNPVQYQDNLTGAFDKSYFESWIKEEISGTRPLFLIMVNVMNYSEIVSLHGEGVVNNLMIDLAGRLKVFDDFGSVFRVSDSGMLIHFHNNDKYEKGIINLKAVIEKYEAENNFDGVKIHIAGISHVEELVKEYSVYSYFRYLFEMPSTQDSIVVSLSNSDNLKGFKYEMEVEHYIREAIEKDLFTIAIQPIYNLKEKCFTEAEVLSRLSHPEFGLLNTQHLINVAESGGIISDITYLQFKRICRFINLHQGVLRTFGKFKFNLSPMDLAEKGNVDRLIKVIDDYELDREKFEFEITESVATEYSDVLNDNAEKIISSGITLSLDDFGSGYANLSSITKIPFDSVKIDRTLVLEIMSSNTNAEIYKGIIRTIKNSGLKIICEGVEHKEESDLLESWGADYIQGYYYSKPVTEEQFLDLIRKQVREEKASQNS